MALSQLLGRGVRLETHEAVALARELLAHPCGHPTPDNIQLRADGSAVCIRDDGLPSVANVADLLLTLLPVGTPDVPAPLRYAIARGLEAVEAPPFASLEEFSRTLERFEKGARRDVLKDLLQRGSRPIATPPASAPSATASRPTVVPSRPTLVVRNPAQLSSDPRQPIAPAPPMFRSFGADGEAESRVRASRRWALVAVAALVASFAMGFAVMDGITHRRPATQPSPAPRVEVAGAAAATDDSAANPAQVELREEIVRVPEIAAVTREIVQAPAAAPADAPADASSALNDFSPALPSDGTPIFFNPGSEADARSGLEVATAGRQIGGDLRIMTIDEASHNDHAQPSPDGRLVAFDSDRDGERGIYVANRDGSQVRRVSDAGYAAVPTWSRNGEWLAYIRPEADKPSVWNLWVQPPAGGTARRVTNYRAGQTTAASWFPDDRRVAYSHEDTLMVMDVQTGAATRYRTPVKGQAVRTPAVSPDGTKIIFQVFRHGAWLLNLVDGSMQHVLTDPTADEFAWSPDGRRVAFHSRRDDQWGIYVLLGS